MRIKKISIIIPAYNEQGTIVKSVKRVLSVNLGDIYKEIIVIDDGSKDKTKNELGVFKNKRNIKILFKTKNQGKGAAIRDALKIVTGDLIVIQDADLEYDPHQIPELIKPIKNDLADIVYGSRFQGGKPHRVLLFWHMLGNKFLTLLSNMISNLNLTDMETGYKMFTKDVAQKLKLNENRFGFEPEFTMKISKMNLKVFEIGISYQGRGYSEGKKINWKDGLWAIWCIIRYGIFN